MSVDPEKLAAAVFLKEPIWNPRHTGHKNRTIIQQCWSDLSKEMIIDAYESKSGLSRWRCCLITCQAVIYTNKTEEILAGLRTKKYDLFLLGRT
ncbi:hypothetical protein QTP88_008673 [Uroleucon formosanum]